MWVFFFFSPHIWVLGCFPGAFGTFQNIPEPPSAHPHCPPQGNSWGIASHSPLIPSIVFPWPALSPELPALHE